MEILTRRNAKVGMRVRRNEEEWNYDDQDHDRSTNKPTFGEITNIDKYCCKDCDADEHNVTIQWNNGQENCYKFKQLVIDEVIKAYVSDVSEKDAALKKVEKYIVDVIDDEFPYLCVNTKEDVDSYHTDPKSVKTSSWMFISFT